MSPEGDPLAFSLLARCVVRFRDVRDRRGRGATRSPVASDGHTTVGDDLEAVAAARRLESRGLVEVSPFAEHKVEIEWWVSLTEEGLAYFEDRWEWSRFDCRWITRAARSGEQRRQP